MAKKKKKPVYARYVDDITGDARLRSFLHTLTGELREKLVTRYTYTSEQRAAIQRQCDRAPKKARVIAERDLAAAATDDFLVTNQEAGSVSLAIDSDVVSNAALFIRAALERFTRDHDDSSRQCSLSLSLLLSLWRFGPGASALTNRTHFADKIRLKVGSVTQRALPLAVLLRRMDPHLRAFDGQKGYKFKVVRGSSLSTVPKNEDTHRTIATEPLWNMALQLAAGCYIEGALRRVGLDITSQSDINVTLAEIGSVTGGLATIDLKSASDLITIALIKLLWPPEWYELLMTIRSPEVRVNGEWVTANMMSTMGNGFTFPMMTLTLLALIYGFQSKRLTKPMFWDPSNTAVFGDDIIVPTEDFEGVCGVLCSAGLKVNLTKSFADGPFRESCGGDFHKGYNVTPFYVKSLTCDPEVYVAINQLISWASRVRVTLPRSFQCLIDMLHNPKKPLFVPCWFDSTSGIQTGMVGRRYSFWKVKAYRKNIDFIGVDPFLAMKIALGGYVTSATASRVTYTPRLGSNVKVRYELDDSRLPRGYLDGWDPVLRGPEAQNWANEFIRAVLEDGEENSASLREEEVA